MLNCINSRIIAFIYNIIVSVVPVLVSRVTRQRYLDVSDEWTEDVHTSAYSTLKFKYRVTCDSHYYGKGCENLCRPRDDSFGHYSCSPSGERVCLAGWTGDYCTKGKCLFCYQMALLEYTQPLVDNRNRFLKKYIE